MKMYDKIDEYTCSQIFTNYYHLIRFISLQSLLSLTRDVDLKLTSTLLLSITPIILMLVFGCSNSLKDSFTDTKESKPSHKDKVSAANVDLTTLFTFFDFQSTGILLLFLSTKNTM